MVTVREIAWLGGLLEGEGCFAAYKGLPTIKLNMTDRDTVVRAAGILGTEMRGPYASRNPRHKPQCHANLFGNPAIGWMMTLYSFLGFRRREAVRAVIAQWKANPGTGARNARKTHCPQSHPYSAENTYVEVSGARQCKICRKEARRRSAHAISVDPIRHAALLEGRRNSYRTMGTA